MVKEKHRSKNNLHKKNAKKLKKRLHSVLCALGRFYDGIAVFLSDWTAWQSQVFSKKNGFGAITA
jgi:hypothetical protein